jgi:hypothetical protein
MWPRARNETTIEVLALSTPCALRSHPLNAPSRPCSSQSSAKCRGSLHFQFLKEVKTDV